MWPISIRILRVTINCCAKIIIELKYSNYKSAAIVSYTVNTFKKKEFQPNTPGVKTLLPIKINIGSQGLCRNAPCRSQSTQVKSFEA